MKGTKLASILAISTLLAGCAGGTPNCADSDTLAILDEAIKTEVDKYADRNRSTASEGFRVLGETYEISHIRTLEYDENIDSYQCDARITYQLKEREQSVDFSYRVDTDQGDGDVLVEYQMKMLKPIVSFFITG
ncbi:hypothetical protein N5E02_01120 [Stenotrophomonas sp. GD03777]|uniref:hypothetical protein n=1 Tax=Stenotrophomonas sp. GD03777 TaxID=2975380 RepID=UPI002446FBEB|nr:hypothetical protein [Stenotrophomonas sp. GD03777]MDH1660017.1 hypothetical protein [Stenotrophomonas sp. GD03777]